MRVGNHHSNCFWGDIDCTIVIRNTYYCECRHFHAVHIFTFSEYQQKYVTEHTEMMLQAEIHH